jgi:hypothetical protein
VDEATAKQIANGNINSDWAQGYGYQFWRCQHGAYRGDGAFGQYCIVFPEQDAVLAITSAVDNMQSVLDLVWEHLLPAMGAAPLPDNPAAQAGLAKRLSGLVLAPPQGQPTSPLAAQVSGKCYQFELNPMKLASISFDFSPQILGASQENCRVVINDANGEHQAVCSSLGWQIGTGLRFLNQSAVTAVNGVWTAEDTYELTIRFIETPFFNTYRCHFSDDQVRISGSINVSFGPKETSLLVGHV